MGDFLSDVTRNHNNAAILQRWVRFDLPDAWLVAGCLFQTVWNLQSGRDAASGIKDYDLFYFDGTDLTEAAEKHAGDVVNELVEDLGVVVDVANQARVHQWYERHFGHSYDALRSSADGIARFLVLETCVGVRPGDVIAPHGVEGVYRGTLSPNPLVPHEDLFAAKVKSYCARWPHLVVT